MLMRARRLEIANSSFGIYIASEVGRKLEIDARECQRGGVKRYSDDGI